MQRFFTVAGDVVDMNSVETDRMIRPAEECGASRRMFCVGRRDIAEYAAYGQEVEIEDGLAALQAA